LHNTKRNNDRNNTLDKNYNSSNNNNNNNNSNNGTDDANKQNRRDYELTDMYILNSYNTHAMTDTTDDNYTNRFSDSISHSPPHHHHHPSLSSTSTNVVMDMIDKHFSIHNMIRDFNESMPVVVLPSNFEVRKGILIDSDPKNRLLHSVYHQQYDDDEVEVEEDDDGDDNEDSKNYNDKNNDDCDKTNNNSDNHKNDTG